MNGIDETAPYTEVSKITIYENPWLCLTESKTINRDGKDGIFGIVSMKDGTSVVALIDEDILLIREYRFAMRSHTIELISGGIENGEDPISAGLRELREEAGYQASYSRYIGFIDPFTSLVKSRNHLLLATDLTPVELNPDDGEYVELIRVPFSRAVEMVLTGEITHGASCVGILRAKLLLEGKR